MITMLVILLMRLIFRRKDLVPPAKKLAEARSFVHENGMDEEVCILVDYGLRSGRNRLWVWNFDEGRAMLACPVAHGRGHEGSPFSRPRFSNADGSWLSSLGRCLVAERYEGGFGSAYRLDGLDAENSNMRSRCVVLHGYRNVPSRPVFPLPNGRSRGCVVVSPKNMEVLDSILRNRCRVLLWTYCSSSASKD